MKAEDEQILNLKAIVPFARGANRNCYVHPSDPTICVKVCIPGSMPHDKRRRAPAFKRILGLNRFDDNWQEAKELKTLSDRFPWAAGLHFPRWRGWARTDLGPGLLMDLFRDYDSQISQNLSEYLWANGINSIVQSGLDQLSSFLINNRILTRTPVPHNVVVRIVKPGQTPLMALVDGFGDQTFFPIARLIAPLGRRYVRKRMSRFHAAIADLLAARQAATSRGMVFKPQREYMRGPVVRTIHRSLPSQKNGTSISRSEEQRAKQFEPGNDYSVGIWQ